MRFEDWPEEWQEWAEHTPLERFRETPCMVSIGRRRGLAPSFEVFA
jgi:hypothetical protein